MRDRLIQVMLKGRPTGWFSPTNKVLADTWRETKLALSPITVNKSEDEHRIEIIGGGVVEMWSLESPDAGRSRKYARVVIDEAAMAPNLMTAWEANIRPTLTDFQGDAWIVSTPKGINSFKTLFDRGPDPSRPDWMSWQMPTLTNPHISPEEIESARLDSTEAYFNQEYLALFVNWEGSAFRNVDLCATAVPQDGPIEGHEYVVGADWGRSRDYTVFIVVDITLHAAVFMDRSNRVDYSLQRNRLKALRDKWNPSTIIAELNSIGEPIIERLGEEGIQVQPFTTTNSSKSVAVDALALAFERMDISIIPDPVLVSELVAFQGTILPSGLIRYSAPEGNHDDCVMALLMAWTAVSSRNVFGVLAYQKSQQEKSMTKVVTPRMTKPVMGEKSMVCPQCESVAVVLAGGHKRCNQCGHEYGFSGNPVVTGSYLRSNYLIKKAGRN